MKNIISFKDPHLGNVFIVLAKIREVCKGLGSVVLTYDNGDKRTIDSKNQDELMNQIVEALEEYYKK